jgi:hypothetical protein
MTVEFVGIAALLIGILSLYCQPSVIVYVFLCTTLLGAAAAFVLTNLGGTNISPAHLLLCFLVLRLFRTPEMQRNAIEGLSFGRPGSWFLLTVIYSTVAAYVMPRIFAGQTMIFAVRAQTSFSIPLSPAMSNLTQSVYFIGDLVCFVAIYAFASTPNGHRVAGKAVIACATVNLIFAVLDILTYLTGTADLFAPIRNANYSMLNDTEMAGFKRIVGSFTEASSFGALTLGYFGYTGKLWLLGAYPRVSGILALLSLTALVFSTSTTAYVGLCALLAFGYVETLIHALYRPATRATMVFLVGAPFIAALLVISIELSDTYSYYIKSLLDQMVLNKMSTDSGVERSSWNRQAIQNFVDTFGFGAGNGSVRSSSILFGIPASLGVLGTLLFGLFFSGVFLGKPKGPQFDRVDDAFRQGAKYACLGWFIAGATSGAVIDLGLPFFALAALAAARPARSKPGEFPAFRTTG